MNTSRLAKLYDQLKPEERLPLIMAASGRGDEQERSRLVNAAPKVQYMVPDYFGLAQALREVSAIHLLELLALGALFFQGLGMLGDGKTEGGERALDATLFFGYLFRTNLLAWRRFCAENQWDPDLLWQPLPGYGTVRSVEHLTETIAFTEGGADAYVALLAAAKPSAGQDTPGKALTVEGATEALRACLKSRLEWWD